jgi:hypothetical protein
VEIALTEYGAQSDTSEYYINKFIEDNNLTGSDLLMLEKGREVVVYAG